MSRSDLDEIQKQLKVAIQNHQMLMAQMKNNPQDTSLQRRIHATQREISALGEKQKGIFQLLRKANNPPNRTAQDTQTLKPNAQPVHRHLLPAHMPVVSTSITLATTHTTPVSAPNALTGARNKVHTTPSKPMTQTKPVAKPGSTVTIPIQAHANSLPGKSNLVLPANLNSLALALGPNATLTLPMSTGGSLTLPASALPPHLLKPGTRLTLPVAGRNIPLVPVKPKISTAVTTVQLSSRPATSSPAPSSPSNQRSGSSLASHSFIVTSQSRTNQQTAEKPVDPAKLKQDFMASLDLVSPERMKELQCKRTERKRRTTANPNFSYGNSYANERKYGLNNYLSAMQVRRHHRHRGESPLPHSLPPSPCSANGVQGHTYLHNGESMDVHDDYCAVCRRSGQLLMCDTCSLVYHLHCLNPPLTQIPTGTWRCPKCEVEYRKRQVDMSPVTIADNNNTPQKAPIPSALVVQDCQDKLTSPQQASSVLRQSLTPPYSSAEEQQKPPPPLTPVQPLPQQQRHSQHVAAALSAATPLVIPKPTLLVPRPPFSLVTPSLSSLPEKTASPGRNVSPGTALPSCSGGGHAATPPGISKENESSDSVAVKDGTKNNHEQNTPMETEESDATPVDNLASKDSVTILRTVKEEERRKLLARKETLQAENTQLKHKAEELSQSISAQLQTKADLVQSVESTQQSIDAIHQFIEVFKT